MMFRLSDNVATVFVVDGHTDDYAGVLQRASDEGLSLRLFHDGRHALRVDTAHGPDLWVVNLKLSDMSGADLLSILRWRFPGVPVALISDEDSPEREIEARSNGAEMYLSKPLRAEWLASATGMRR